MDYQLLKAVHLLGVILFLGNIIVTALWKACADRTGRISVIAFSQRLVTVTDFAFTATGAAIIAISGRIMSAELDLSASPYWLTMGWVLFIASGIIWAVILIPVQIKQARMAKGFEEEGVIPDRYWRLSKYWYTFGLIATILPMANLYFMVFKP